MSTLKSQLIGIVLSIAATLACLFYEKIVNNFSYQFILILYFVFGTTIMFTVGHFVFENDIQKDLSKFITQPKYFWYTLGWTLASMLSSICWFYITKTQGVMVGSIYEIKYIVILALVYIMFGESKFTWNTAIGVSLALGSIYFISKK